MKKLTVLILSVFLVLLCIPCFASGVNVSLGTVTGNPGDVVEIPVILSGNTGFASLGLEIGYDASALELVDVTANTDVGATFTKAQELTANPYNLGWDGAENITFNGTLAVLKFKIKAQPGEYPVTISFYKGRDGSYTDGYDTNFDENFDDIGLSYTNGKVTVVEKKEFAITDYAEGNNISFKVTLPEERGHVIAAIFGQDGKMLSAKRMPGKTEIGFEFSEKGKQIKVFWLDSALSPVAVPLIK